MIQELIEKSVQYLQANVLLAAALAGVCGLLVLTMLILLFTAPKRRKARKQKKALALAKAQQERNAQEHAEAERKQAEAIAAAQKAEQERIAAEKAEQERIAAEKAEQERIAAEKAEQERIAAEKAEQERIAAEKAEQERLVAALSTTQQDHAEEQAIEKADAQAEAEEKAIMDAVNKRTQKDLETQAKKQAQKSTQKKAAPKAKAQAEKPQEQPKTESKAVKTAKAPAKAGTRQAVTPAAAEKDATTKKGYSGKWVLNRLIMQLEDDTTEEMYYFELHASNGEKLLSSEEYTSYAGAMRGIQTHKNNIQKGNFKITVSKKGDYIFKLLSGKNMLLCMGENYPTLARCESAVQSTKRFAETAVIEENVQTRTIKVLAEDDAELPPLPDGYNGKWVIDAAQNALGEQVYYFELYANNGEKLLSSEEYTTYIGAVNGIQTHKTNIERNNFRISLTKRGDYIYKLLNGNGQLLSLGEHYKTKRLCQNAVESVRRFALNSPILTDPKYTK